MVCSKAPEHDADHGETDEGSNGGGIALEVARQQQAKSLELRAAMSLARLWRDQANPPSVPLTTKPDPPATVQRFYPGPLTQFQSGVDKLAS